MEKNWRSCPLHKGRDSSAERKPQDQLPPQVSLGAILGKRKQAGPWDQKQGEGNLGASERFSVVQLLEKGCLM